MDAPWRIRLLGTLEARRGDLEVTRFATSRVAALLARLALPPQRAHPREELIDLLWPDSDAAAGRLSLRVALASLRRQLEPPGVPPGAVLVADRSAVRLNPPAFTSDAAGFEAALRAAARAPGAREKRRALDEAGALFRGELLPGFYDEWIQDERGRLNALFDEACHARDALPPAPLPSPPSGETTPGKAETRGFPIPWTRFFGREDDRAHLARWVADPETRLLTLSGPGGVGKTRLAGEVARAARAAFPGPVCFVSLADLGDAEGLPGAIAQALGLPRSPASEPLDQVAAALGGQPPALLVLDNLEHLVERGAPLVLALLSRVPSLTCLVTSRRRLGLPGEREYPVPPLPLPAPGGALEDVALAASVRLFVDRAQAARPDFQLTRANAEAVTDLCRKLEGLPLALELVAARASALTPAAMNERLGHPFEILTSRRGDKGGRHRSLWAAIGWSHDLLPPPLQRFFLGLSVFRGGCTAEAAQAVCEEPAALEMLTQLRERSLALSEDAGADLRFRLLEPLREFGGERLEAGEASALACRHTEYFLGVAEASREALRGPGQARWLDRLEADHDNLRAALQDTSRRPDAGEAGLRLAAALQQFWGMRGHLREGRRHLEDALARAAGVPPALRASALHGAGFLAYWQGDYPATQACNEAALALWPLTDDRLGPIRSLQMRANALLYQGRLEEAAADFTVALARAREVEGEGLNSTTSLGGLAIIAHWKGDHARARDLYTQVARINERCGNHRDLALSLYNLGEIAHGLGETDQAQAHYERSLALCRAHGGGFVPLVLIGLALVAAGKGEMEAAQSLYGESLALSRETGEEGDTAIALRGLGSLAVLRGDCGRARHLLSESLTIHWAQGDKRQALETLVQSAARALAEGEAGEAGQLLDAAEALQGALETHPSPAERAERGRLRAALVSTAGAESGAGMTWEQAVDHVLRAGRP